MIPIYSNKLNMEIHANCVTQYIIFLIICFSPQFRSSLTHSRRRFHMEPLVECHAVSLNSYPTPLDPCRIPLIRQGLDAATHNDSREVSLSSIVVGIRRESRGKNFLWKIGHFEQPQVVSIPNQFILIFFLFQSIYFLKAGV